MKPNSKRCFGRVLPLALALLAPAPVIGQHFPPDDDLRAMLKYLVEDGETTGIVLGVLEADGSTRIVSFGSAGPDARPLGPRTVFETGSLGKTFTGTLLATALARGQVNLNDPVSNYLPDSVRVPSRAGREITLLDLATHTSGLPSVTDNFIPSDPEAPWDGFNLGLLYDFLSTFELPRDPGSQWQYSNLGMGLLGQALVQATDTPYRDLVSERILEPLGMTRIGYEMDGERAEWMAQGHRYGEVFPYWSIPDGLDGAGGLLSDVEDLLKFLRANVGAPETDLERAMRVAHESKVSQSREGRWSGLAWHIWEYQGRTIIRHGGDSGGFHVQLAFDQEAEVGAVLLTNHQPFGDNFALDLVTAIPVTEVENMSIAPVALSQFEGSYASDGGLSLFFRLDDEGRLTAQVPRQTRVRLYATSDSTFFAKRVPFSFTFLRNTESEIEAVVLGVGGRTNQFEKTGEIPPHPMVTAGNVIPPLSPEEIAQYEGTYLVEVGGETVEFRVYGQGESLMGEIVGMATTRLMPRDDHQFIAALGSHVRAQFTVVDGQAERVSLLLPNRSGVGVRRR